MSEDSRLLKREPSATINAYTDDFLAGPHRISLDGSFDPQYDSDFVTEPEDDPSDWQEGLHGRRSFVGNLDKQSIHHPTSLYSTYESLDYDPIHNKVYRQSVQSRTVSDFEHETRVKWCVAFLIGLCMALVAFVVDRLVNLLKYGKEGIVVFVLNFCKGCLWLPLFVSVAVSVIYCIVSASLVLYGEPLAGGSGIPEIKCYLNGLKIPMTTRLKTLVCKLIGVSFCVSAGLVVGKEGPMIHSGAIIGAGVSQGSSVTASWDLGLLKSFRNDPEKRDFVAGGVAAGVAAAFGSPVGGVLLTLEEGASHWNQALTWRTFFCATVASVVLNFLLSCGQAPVGPEDEDSCVGSGCGFFSQPGLITFGSFSNTSGWTIFHLPFFVILGALGGALGAGFIILNKQIVLFRQKHLQSKMARMMEVVLLCVVTTSLQFIIPYYFSHCYCSQIPSDGPSILTAHCFAEDPIIYGDTDSPCDLGSVCRDCGTWDNPTCYSDTAVLLFADEELAIRALFHWKGGFSITALCISLAYLWLMGCWSQGAAIPTGIFIPSLLTGGVLGRLFCEVLRLWLDNRDPRSITFLDPGMFALIGAVAFLGGISRTTISLTVMMVEATNDVTYALPIMITVMVSKWVGDSISEGMYEIYIETRRIPFLNFEAPHYMRKWKARQVMSYPLVKMGLVMKVGEAYAILNNCGHNGFPIVNDAGRFVGLILRSQLITILRKKVDFVEEARQSRNFYYGLGLDDFLEDYPRCAPLDSLSFTEEEKEMYVDLTPYMQPTPYCVHHSTLLERVFTLFRTMGLRHLTVVDSENIPQGMITRKNLVHLEDVSQQLHSLGTASFDLSREGSSARLESFDEEL